MELFTASGLAVLGQVLMIDLVLSGDNAVVIGLAVAGLSHGERKKGIILGIGAAVILRIVFAVIAVQLLEIKGILLLGGLLLLWVCWKMFQDLRPSHQHESEEATAGAQAEAPQQKSLFRAVWQIVIADVSMSLDNVLAVAGAAREHITVLVIGLLMSVILMAVAANWIAKLIERYRWIGYAGLAILVFVSARMIFDGAHQLLA